MGMREFCVTLLVMVGKEVREREGDSILVGPCLNVVYFVDFKPLIPFNVTKISKKHIKL